MELVPLRCGDQLPRTHQGQPVGCGSRTVAGNRVVGRTPWAMPRRRPLPLLCDIALSLRLPYATVSS